MRSWLLGWLLFGALVVTVLVVPAGGAVAWLIVRGRGGWGTGETIGAIAVGVAIGAGIAAVIATVFGTPLFQLWIDKRSPRAQTTPSPEPVAQARKGGALDERKQDRLAMRELLHGVKDELFPKGDP